MCRWRGGGLKSLSASSLVPVCSLSTAGSDDLQSARSISKVGTLAKSRRHNSEPERAPRAPMAAPANNAAVTQVLEQPAQFELLLLTLMSANNEERVPAEAIFAAAKSFPDQVVAQLVRCLRTCDKLEAREMSAILLRTVR